MMIDFQHTPAMRREFAKLHLRSDLAGSAGYSVAW